MSFFSLEQSRPERSLDIVRSLVGEVPDLVKHSVLRSQDLYKTLRILPDFKIQQDPAITVVDPLFSQSVGCVACGVCGMCGVCVWGWGWGWGVWGVGGVWDVWGVCVGGGGCGGCVGGVGNSGGLEAREVIGRDVPRAFRTSESESE
jgi:hypothetical protein